MTCHHGTYSKFHERAYTCQTWCGLKVFAEGLVVTTRWLDEDEVFDDNHGRVAEVTCTACILAHFANKASGVASPDNDPRERAGVVKSLGNGAED